MASNLAPAHLNSESTFALGSAALVFYVVFHGIFTLVDLFSTERKKKFKIILFILTAVTCIVLTSIMIYYVLDA